MTHEKNKKKTIIIILTGIILILAITAIFLLTRKDSYPTYTDRDGSIYICAFLRDITEDSITVDVAEYITPDNPKRVKELQLTEYDLINGYHIYNPDTKTVTWKLDSQTVYHFVDWYSDFTGAEGVEEYTTMDILEFKKYLATYTDSKPRMPFFFQIEDGVVKLLLEKWMA